MTIDQFNQAKRIEEEAGRLMHCLKCCWHMEWLLDEVWCTLRTKPKKAVGFEAAI